MPAIGIRSKGHSMHAKVQSKSDAKVANWLWKDPSYTVTAGASAHVTHALLFDEVALPQSAL